MIQLSTYKLKTNMIQVYPPTSDKSDNDTENLFEDLDCVLKSTNNYNGRLQCKAGR